MAALSLWQHYGSTVVMATLTLWQHYGSTVVIKMPEERRYIKFVFFLPPLSFISLLHRYCNIWDQHIVPARLIGNHNVIFFAVQNQAHALSERRAVAIFRQLVVKYNNLEQNATWSRLRLTYKDRTKMKTFNNY